MFIRLPHPRSFGIRRFTLCLMLLVLSLRALVPTGFMPDTGALRDGRLEMTFCTAAGGMRTFTVDSRGDPAPASGGEQTHQVTDCPFSLLTALPAMLSMAPVIVGLALLAWSVPPAPRHAARPSMPAQGPPLGSRAPPFHLV
jgi:hypothetical protein